MIEAEAIMRNTTEAPVDQQTIDIALIGKGGLQGSHHMVKKKSIVETTRGREVDMIGL